jgi:hypothetical protein
MLNATCMTSPVITGMYHSWSSVPTIPPLSCRWTSRALCSSGASLPWVLQKSRGQVQTHTHTHTHTHARTHTHTRARTRAHVHTRTHARARTHTQTDTHTHTHTSLAHSLTRSLGDSHSCLGTESRLLHNLRGVELTSFAFLDASKIVAGTSGGDIKVVSIARSTTSQQG